jgi:hypothetical protein
MSDEKSITRADYIGGSDSGAIFGLNGYRPRAWVVRQKVLGAVGEWEERDLSGNPHIQRGNQMEPLIHEWVRENLDPTVNAPHVFEELDCSEEDPSPDAGQIFLYDEGGRLGGHPDGVSDHTVHEYKATTTRSLERIFRAGAHDKHLLQTHHYMMLTGRERGMLHYWNYNSWKPLTFELAARPDLYGRMRSEYAKVWEEVDKAVTEKLSGTVEEEMNYGEGAPAGLQLGPLAGRAPDDAEEIEQMARKYEDAKSRQYDAKDERKELKARLLTRLDEKGQIVTPNMVVSREGRNGRYGTYNVVTVSER